MKILSPKEVTDRKQAELVKDIARTKDVKETLETMTSNLAEAEAKFNMALANQRIRWSIEEGDHIKRIKDLEENVKVLEAKKKEALIPIVEREEKSYDLLNAAELTFNEAIKKNNQAEKIGEDNERTADLLQDKLDGVYEKETELEEREKKVLVREMAVEKERDLIKKLSAELSIKLTNLN